MDEELLKMTKYLRLGGLAEHWDEYIKLAQKGNFSHPHLLQYIIESEYKIKMENARKLRLKRAKIDEELVMETFPFHQQPMLNKKKILSLYDSFDYMTKKQNIVWIGTHGRRQNRPGNFFSYSGY